MRRILLGRTPKRTRGLLLALPLLVAACQPSSTEAPPPTIDTAALEQELMRLDREFDADTAERGSRAWRERFAEDGVTVQGSRTVTGPEAIGDSMAALDSGTVTLRWQPLAATVSESGDLGFTRGTYRQTVVSDDGVERVSTGSYLTIWQRRGGEGEEEGEWKIILDTGSPDRPAPPADSPGSGP